MMDAFQRALPGKPMRIPAMAYNAMLDAAEAHRKSASVGGASAGAGQGGPHVVRLRNDSGADVPQYGILGLGDIIHEWDPDDAALQAEFMRNPRVFAGELPAATHARRWALALHAIPQGQIGAAAVLGVYPCLLEVGSGSHEQAGPTAGDVTKLTSAASGTADVLWKEDGTGEKRALVFVRPFSAAGETRDPLWFAGPTDPGYFGGSVMFGGDAENIRAYNDMQQPFKHRLSPTERAGATYNDGYDSQNDFSQSSGRPHFRSGVGAVLLSRYYPNWPTTNTVWQSMARWNGESLSDMEELPLPDGVPATSSTIPSFSTPFVLEDGTLRFFRVSGTAAPYTPELWKYGTHGGSITGELKAKAATTQPVGQTFVTVTTATTGGALDLKAGNEIKIGAKTYRVSTDVAEPDAGENVSVLLTASLTVELTGGEVVTLSGSWAIEKAAATTASAGGTSINHYNTLRGWPTERYFLGGAGAFFPGGTNPSDGVVGYTYRKSTGDFEQVPNNALSIYGGYYAEATSIQAYGITGDGHKYVLATQQYISGGTLLSRRGLLRHSGSSWDWVELHLPAGLTRANPEYQWSGETFIHTPDGRLIFSVAADRVYNGSSYYFALFYIIESNKAPKLIYSGAVPFVLRSRDGAAVQALWGCSADGWEEGGNGSLYIAGIPRAVNQVTEEPFIPPSGPFLPDGCVPVYSGGLYRLDGGGSPESEINGTVAAKSATVQAVGVTSLQLTTGAASNCDLKAGSLLTIGTGDNARTHAIAADVAEPNQSTDFTVTLATGLTVALAGGEPVVLSAGWASEVAEIGVGGIHQHVGGGTSGPNTIVSRFLCPLK
jgi:hypothetical protein